MSNFTEKFFVPSESYKTEQDVLKSRNYKQLNLVGRGAYGAVYRFERKTDSAILACKIVDLSKRNFSRMMKHFKTELYVMMKCQHENIIRIEDHFLINSKAYIVMEYANSGTLTDAVHLGINEKKCRSLFNQIVQGLFHMHKNHIAHRDLKLDNILISATDSKLFVKITDFGLSCAAYDPQKGYIESGNFAGTRLYMAPEIIQIRVYKDLRPNVCFDFDPFKADIWALGVCFCEMMTSKMPFYSNNDQELLRQQLNCIYTFTNDDRLSNESKNLLTSLLDPNPDTRIDPFGILTHPWITNQR